MFGLLHDTMMMAARRGTNCQHEVCGQDEGLLALGWSEEADAGWYGSVEVRIWRRRNAKDGVFV
jgi:hypothetical protein